MTHQHRGAGGDRSLAQVCVEDVASKCCGVVRQVAVTGPRRGGLALAVNEAHAGESVAAERNRIDVEACEFTQRSGGQRVAARLVARDRSFLDDGDVMAGPGQPGGDRGSGRTTADDEDVGVQGACRQPADAGEPGIASGPIGVISAPPISGASGEV
jgi:hypothetical protein